MTILLAGGFVAFIAAYAVAQHIANHRLEQTVKSLVGQLATMRTALRAAGIPMPDDPPEVVNTAPAPRIPSGPPRHAAKGGQR